jgi:teichuronic acid biosynthesis glycosyltransferase TuaC
MRILFLSMGYPSSKNPSRIVFLQRLVNELADQGHTCHVIAPVKLPIDKNTVIGKEIQKSPMGQSVTVYFPGYACFWLTARTEKDPFKKLSVNNYISAVQRTIKKNKLDFDVVYSHFLGISAECAIKIAETYHKPCFAAAGESVFSYFDAPDGEHVYEYLNKLTGIISVSTENKQLLLARGILTDEKIKVFPNGIDASVFYPRNKAESREAFGFNSEDFIVAFTGQFIDRKGVLRLEQACKELPVKVAYAGSGPQIPSALNTIWKKPIKPEDMPFFLSAADIFCLPTLNEGCCNAIIEALACGLPVVSSDRLFNDDILDNKCSIRIDCADVEQIRNAISKLLNDKSIITQMSMCALNRGRMLTLNERAANIVKWIEQMK